MRKVTEKIKEAFKLRKSLKIGNTETDGETVWLFGNPIVKRDQSGLVLWSLAGWNTVTTRERVNGIVDAGVRQVKGRPVLANGHKIVATDWFVAPPPVPALLVV